MASFSQFNEVIAGVGEAAGLGHALDITDQLGADARRPLTVTSHIAG
ncbi:MAG: hypothetical protein QGM46_09980 [Actinomycetota bacterium]|nr:hypothetical protein [Actinomycetota bacterium]MDK1016182.1 hypothetical protein [Actinomycetota bacterium]MDK1026189.1 hypothetical protein [Actinomycetota bacterium]MDK1096462.1 hypothetical protein [Actinomycetota bacterium]MDK1103462.1 hypothetical protein [Actinomycetota bacterium]